MNTVNLTGRLTRDPELIQLADDKQVCRMRLAVEDMGRGNQAGFINVSAFGPSGEACARVLSQGWLVAVDGRLDFHEWTPEGTDVARSEIAVVGRVEFLVAPQTKDDAEPASEAVAA
jgi:single-strand DNA-binding protein